jgi:hypothetical protein
MSEFADEPEGAALVAAGWEPCAGEYEEGFLYAQSPDGALYRRKSEAVARWRRNAEARAALTPYQRRKAREAEAHYWAHRDAMAAAYKEAAKVVRREAFRAIRRGQTSNVVMFTRLPEARFCGVSADVARP